MSKLTAFQFIELFEPVKPKHLPYRYLIPYKSHVIVKHTDKYRTMNDTLISNLDLYSDYWVCCCCSTDSKNDENFIQVYELLSDKDAQVFQLKKEYEHLFIDDDAFDRFVTYIDYQTKYSVSKNPTLITFYVPTTKNYKGETVIDSDELTRLNPYIAAMVKSGYFDDEEEDIN